MKGIPDRMESGTGDKEVFLFPRDEGWQSKNTIHQPFYRKSRLRFL